MKKQSNLSWLLSYAGRYRNFTYASWILYNYAGYFTYADKNYVYERGRYDCKRRSFSCGRSFKRRIYAVERKNRISEGFLRYAF